MASASFAAKLDEALIAAPWSLDRIVAILAEQDLHISQATLSHWRSGRSVPKRRNSFPIIAALEDLLGLPPHSLRSLIRSNTETPTNYLAPVSGKEPDPIDSDFAFLFNESDNATDWSNDIQRELLEKETVISADFLTQTHTFVILARIPKVKNPCLHVSIGLTETSVMPEVGYIDLYNIKGATIGERKLYANGRTTVTRLDLPPSCHPGQLHRVSYTYSYKYTEPLKKTSSQAFAWPLHFYINRVEFEGKVPEKIEWVDETVREEESATYSSISTRPVYPFDNTVQVCIEKPQATRGHFRWE